MLVQGRSSSHFRYTISDFYFFPRPEVSTVVVDGWRFINYTFFKNKFRDNQTKNTIEC